MAKAHDYNALRSHFGMFASGDPWGDCMGFLFAVCDVLEFDRESPKPWDWGYRPGAASEVPEETRMYGLEEFSTEALEEFGEVLGRYRNVIRAAGKDY